MGESPPTGERPAVEPPRRRFSARRAPQRLRDVDAGDRAARMQAALWGVVIGGVGVFVSLLLSFKVGAEPPLSYLFPVGGALAGVLVYKLSVGTAVTGGAVMGQIHNPAGTPVVREYSQPQALAARGNFREAIEAYEDLAVIYPDDPEPYLRIARLYRDALHEYDHAVVWFKRARSSTRMEPSQEILVSQEIIEVYRRRLDQPRRAIPELARLVERFPDHPSHAALRRELQTLRDELLRSPEAHDESG